MLRAYFSLLCSVFLMAVGVAYLSVQREAGSPKGDAVPTVGNPLSVVEVVVIRNTDSLMELMALIAQYGHQWGHDSYPLCDTSSGSLVVYVRVSPLGDAHVYHQLVFPNVRPMPPPDLGPRVHVPYRRRIAWIEH